MRKRLDIGIILFIKINYIKIYNKIAEYLEQNKIFLEYIAKN